MTPDELDFLPLKVTHIDEGGRRCFVSEGKRRLIEACEKPSASVAGLALKAGVNATQLRKWIMLERRRLTHTDSHKSTCSGSVEFVSVMEIAEPDAVTAGTSLPSSLPTYVCANALITRMLTQGRHAIVQRNSQAADGAQCLSAGPVGRAAHALKN